MPRRYHRWTDEELIASAKCYRHRTDWKMGDNRAYQVATWRPKVFALAVAHMTPRPYRRPSPATRKKMSLAARHRAALKRRDFPG
jgi:hypothetical protein